MIFSSECRARCTSTNSMVLFWRRGVGIRRILRALKSRRKFGASRYPRKSGARKSRKLSILVRNSTRLDRYLPSHKPAYDRSTKKAAARKGRNIHRPFAAQCRTLTTTMDAIMSASSQETPTCASTILRRNVVEFDRELSIGSANSLNSFLTSGCMLEICESAECF